MFSNWFAAVFQIDLPLGALFKQRTIAVLADAIEEILIDELSKKPDDIATAKAWQSRVV
jgi:hypothetical protein